MANLSKAVKSLKIHPTSNSKYNAAKDREDNYIGRKITEARVDYGISQRQLTTILAEYGIEASGNAISKWERGQAVPNAYQLLALAQIFHLDHDLSYFTSVSSMKRLNKEGRDKVASYLDDLIASGNYKPAAPANSIIRFVDMQVSNLRVSAGTGAFLDEGNFETVSFPESSIPVGAEFGIRVSGDSMEPVYHDGQIVWIKQCDHLNVGEVGVFICDGEGYIKVYNEQKPADDDLDYYTDSYGVLHMQPVMVSYNCKYEPRVVSAHTPFQIVGKVL